MDGCDRKERMPIAKEKWIEAIEQTVAPKFAPMNVKAFELGRGE